MEAEQEEEERAEPREGEGEWQQIEVPMLPPGMLEVRRLYVERAGRRWGGMDEGRK